jgi:hypothetical protein
LAQALRFETENETELEITRQSMQKLLKHFLLFAMASLLLAACNSIPIIGPATERTSLQAQRSASAALDLESLENIDTLIRLNNKWLAKDIKSVLQEQARSNPAYTFRKLNVNFTRQIIALKATIDVNYEPGQTISAELSGDILLDFDGPGLVWLPRFKDLRISSRNFVFKELQYPEPTAEVAQDLLQTMTSDIATPIVQQTMNLIPLDAIPLGEIQVGASLPGFSDSSAISSRTLKGKVLVAGSATLIESSVTTIALDLSFIPEISSCPADIRVSRAMFTNRVVSREPVEIVENLGGQTSARYFYSEISGVKQPISIIHYWFADGLPVTAEELPVEPSTRWRTWSGKGAASQDAKRWEVLVVEKETGCILFADSIRALETLEDMAQADLAQARQAFASLKESFKQRTGGFSIHDEKPDIALVEIQRPFLSKTLQEALADTSMSVEFDSSSLSPLHFSATLRAFNPQDIVCEERKCPTTPACKADVTQCKKLRDTRDCSSCKFRNPLNNRCVSEFIDPLCEASRDRQNAIYEAEQANCIADAEDMRQACEQLAVQATRSCQSDPNFKGPMCESIKADLLAAIPSSELARISTQARAAGSLTINFSNFRIEDDLENLKLDMRLTSDLQLDGDLVFTPYKGNQSLADCISGWNSAFTTRFATIPSVNDLMNPIEATGDTLTAKWSGFGLSLGTNPSPIEAVFIEHPELLASCHIGLKLGQVEQSISNDNSGFFNGQLHMEIQPLPTIINLAPVSIKLWDKTYLGEAYLSDRYLRFDLGE